MLHEVFLKTKEEFSYSFFLYDTVYLLKEVW